MTPRVARNLAAALILGGAVTGCGADEQNADEYRAAVNTICTAGNERIEALFETSSLGPDATEPQLTEMLDSILAAIGDQIDEIDALDAPDDLATDVDAWLAESRTTAEEVRASGAAFFEQQASGVNPFAAVNKEAVELGFDACGE